jgi:hypothetical protein
VSVAFYRQKQIRRGGVEDKFVEAIKISPAEGEIFIYDHDLVDYLSHLRLTELGICRLPVRYVQSAEY